MSLNSGYASAILKLLLNGTTITNIAENATTTPSTGFWIAAHETDPGSTGTQDIGETAYTGYGRVYIDRTSTAWSVSATAGNASPTAAITFGTATTTSTGTLTYASIGLSSSGATDIVAYGAISPTINYGQNVIPQLTTGSSFTLV